MLSSTSLYKNEWLILNGDNLDILSHDFIKVTLVYFIKGQSFVRFLNTLI